MTLHPAFVIDRLDSSVHVFQGLLGAVTEQQASWKPSSEKWSLLEVINHLADEEKEDFGTRLRLVLKNPDDDWPPINPVLWATVRQYNNRNLLESLDRFVRTRRESVDWLRSLPQTDWRQTPARPVGKPRSAGDLLCSWLAHDLIHIRQMNRLHYEYLSKTTPEFSTEYAGTW